MKNLTVLLLFFGCLRVEAHVGDVVYPIFELTDADLARLDLNDGSVADWELVLGAPTLTGEDAFRYVAPLHCDSCAVVKELPAPEDLDFAIWLGWHPHSNRLYFAAERFDDVLLPTGGDRFQLRIDGDHQGGTYVDWGHITHCNTCWSDDCDPRSRVDHLAQTYSTYPPISAFPADSPNPINLDDRAVYWASWDQADWATYADGGSQVDMSASPVYWVAEFYATPFDSLIYNDVGGSRVSLLSAGKVIGFDVVVSDADDANDIYTYDDFSLSGDREADSHAHFFVDGLLVGKASSTSVAQDTWGRIKATFIP